MNSSTTTGTIPAAGMPVAGGTALHRAQHLHDVIELISSELALEPLLTRIVESAAKLIGAQYGSIGLVQERPNGLVIQTAAVANMPALAIGQEFAVDVGLAGRVLREQRPVRFERYGDIEQVALPTLTEDTVVGVPIWWRERMIGFFGIGAPQPHRFSDDDVATLVLLARHAAIAIHNARRYDSEQRRSERLAAIARIGRLVTEDLRIDALLQTAADSIHDLLGYPNVAIALLDPAAPDTLLLRAVGGHWLPLSEAAIRLPLGSIMGSVVRERRPLLVNDVLHDPRYIATPGLEGIRAELAVPILHGEGVLGVLNVESGEPFVAEDAESLQIIADQLAVAIENARLFRAEQRRAARSAATNRVAQLINSSLSLDTILQTAVEAICDHLHYNNVALLLVDPDDPQMLVLQAFGGMYQDAVQGEYRQHIADGFIGMAARSRRPVLINDVQHDGRYVPVPGHGDIVAELAVPITAGERLLGVLNIESTEHIKDDEADGFERIAEQLAIAVENARRYREEQQRTARLELIARVGQRIAARLDLDDLVQTTVKELHEQLGYDHVSLFLVDPEDGRFLVHHAHASRWPRPPDIGYRQPLHRGIMGAAARERTPQLVADVAADSRYVPIPGAPGPLAELAVPILHGAQVLGVLDVASMRQLQREDVASMQIVADQLAIAIDNAQLFTTTQRALADMHLTYGASWRISTAMTVDDVIVAYLEQIAARNQYGCLVALHEPMDDDVPAAQVVRGRWTPRTGVNLAPMRMPYLRDALSPALDRGQTVMVADARTDTRLSPQARDILAQQRVQAVAMIPLMVRKRRIGMVTLSHGEVHTWTSADLQPYQATAAQLATAIDSRLQHVMLTERSQQLAVLDERRRLARELHDSVTQALFGMSLLAQVLPELWQIDRDEALQSLSQIRDQTRGSLAEMRALLFELRPAEGDNQPLALAIEHHAAAWAQRTGIAATVDATTSQVVPPDVSHALMRITQEALQNVAKHARARHVQISVHGVTPLRLVIADDGQGFVPDEVGGNHFGLLTMRERAAKIEAQFDVQTALGKGTTITVEWPSKQ